MESRMTCFSKSLFNFFFIFIEIHDSIRKSLLYYGYLESLVVLGRIEAMLCIDLGHDRFEVI